MKKNTMMRIASVLLVAVLITTCAISGTFAKYVSKTVGTATADVAAWKFTLGESDDNIVDATVDGSKTFTFNLFETVKDTVDSNTDAQVAAGKIAPGTWGSFEIELTNASDVDANYTITFTIPERDGFNIKYAIGNTYNEIDDEAWKTSLTAQSGTLNYAGHATGSSTVTVTVFWQWEFNGVDADDTAVGVAVAAGTFDAYTVSATIDVTQVD